MQTENNLIPTTTQPEEPGVNPSAPQTPAEPQSPAQPEFSPYPTVNQAEIPQSAPVVTSANLVGLTGSQMQPQKERMPIGIYLIVAFTFVGLVVGFFDTSQNSTFYTIAMLIDLFIAIGLLMRLEAARKAMLFISGILLVITAVSLILLAGLQSRINQSQNRFDAARSNLDLTRLTTEQKTELEKIQQDLRAQKKLTGKAIQLTYIKLGVTALEAIAVVVYLTRPKVKEVFHEMKN